MHCTGKAKKFFHSTLRAHSRAVIIIIIMGVQPAACGRYYVIPRLIPYARFLPVLYEKDLREAAFPFPRVGVLSLSLSLLLANLSMLLLQFVIYDLTASANLFIQYSFNQNYEWPVCNIEDWFTFTPSEEYFDSVS